MTISPTLLVGLVTNPLVDDPLVEPFARASGDERVSEAVESWHNSPIPGVQCPPKVV